MGRFSLRSGELVLASAVALLLAGGAFTPVEGAFIRVPNDVSSIQGAINQASAGDTIAVRPSGSYMERIVINKELVLLGGWDVSYTTRDPSQFETIIDAGATSDANAGQPVTVQEGLTTATVLDGFTIRGGWAPQSTNFLGGGVHCDGASPTIRNNLIRDNRANFGAGILCLNGADAVITGNTITANIEINPSGRAGCGVFARRSAPTITNNDISYNKGSGVRLDESPGIVENNRFEGNTDAGGVGCEDGSDATVRYNYFYLNRSEFGGGVWIDSSSPTVEYNTIEYNEIEVLPNPQNQPGGAGIAIFGDSGSPTIAHNKFEGNFTTIAGGAIMVTGLTSPTIEWNLFKRNGFSTGAVAQDGGAVLVMGNADATIRSNTFFENRAGRGGSIMVTGDASAILEKNIIYGSATGSGVWVDLRGSVTLNCNCLSNNLPAAYTGTTPSSTDIFINPIFCRTDGDTLDLAFNSPCLAENNSGCGNIGAFGKGNCGAFPTNLSLVEPVNAAMLNFDTPTFRWTRSIDPDGGDIYFEFEIDEVSTFDSPMLVNTGSDTFYTLPTEDALVENVTYYWHATAVDEQANSTTSDQIWTLKIDLTDPRLTLGVHQHPYLDSYLDLYVVVNEPISGALDATLSVAGSPQDIDMELIDSEEGLFYESFEMNSSGTAILDVGAFDLAGNSSTAADTFSIEVLRPGAAAAFSSPDGVLAVNVKKGTFPGAAYFLVNDLGASPRSSPAIPAGDAMRPPAAGAEDEAVAGGSSGRLYSVSWSPANAAIPVELSFDGTPEEEGAIYRWDGHEWRELATYRSPDSGKFFARTTKPGLYQVMRTYSPGKIHTTALFQNYPNPFRSTTTMAFNVGGGSGTARGVSIKVFDVKGRLVRSLLDAELEPGPYAVTWDGRNDAGSKCASGLYLYRLKIENETPTARKLILMN